MMIKALFLFLLLTVSFLQAPSQNNSSARANTLPLSQQMAQTAMTKWKDSLVVGSSKDGRARWGYQESLVLRGMEEIYKTTGDKKYSDYIRHHADYYVQADGSIRTYRAAEYSIDNIPFGRIVLWLYQTTGEEKYKKAAALVHTQLEGMPRTLEGGLWHKAIYPWQMWLDGLYMGHPFHAEYVQQFKEGDAVYDDIVNQFVWMEAHARDEKTGLLYHAWDESKGMKWADAKTGRSPQVWSRAMGWYAMALAEMLELLPQAHPGRQKLMPIFNRLAEAIKRYQDPESGVWWQITDSIKTKGNYLESSGSCMFVYALVKGVRSGYLPTTYLETAKKGWDGIIKQFIRKDAAGNVSLTNTCRGAGVGNNPYRDGSYEYYLKEPVVTNDAHGIGAFLHAAVEMEKVK